MTSQAAMNSPNAASERFDTLYAEHFPKVYAFFSICFGSSVADELAQESFLKVWHYVQRYPEFSPECWQAWIFRIAFNVKNDYLRKQYRSVKTMPIDTAPPCSHTNYQVEAQAITAAFQQLDLAEREILLLKNMGFTGQQTAALYNIPASTARSRLASARQRFKKLLDQQGVNWHG